MKFVYIPNWPTYFLMMLWSYLKAINTLTWTYIDAVRNKTYLEGFYTEDEDDYET